MMRERPIIVSERDARQLRALLRYRSEASFRDQAHLSELKAELERAIVLRPEEMHGDVITMQSHVQVRDLANGERSTYELVFPFEADVAARKISVLAPLGTALLGVRKGDDVEWLMPGGMRQLRVERVQQSTAQRSTWRSTSTMDSRGSSAAVAL
jgi:regulator of nucleoside diphosphate kinase